LAKRIHGTGAIYAQFSLADPERQSYRYASLSLSLSLSLLSLFIACPLLAQTTPEQRLAHAYTLEREGKPTQAIVELQALLDEKFLDAPIFGKSWNVLGLAFEDRGNYTDSQHAYERSIHTFEDLPNNVKDYAMALDDFGGLYVATGQTELAVRLRQKAFGLYERSAITLV
jgi:tetratricopeptide (TPR) repeat protein